MEDFFDDADEDVLSEKIKLAELKRAQELEDIRQVVSTEAGQRLFRRLVIIGNFFSISTLSEPEIYFLQGGRNIVSALIHDVLEASPEALQKILYQKDIEDG